MQQGYWKAVWEVDNLVVQPYYSAQISVAGQADFAANDAELQTVHTWRLTVRDPALWKHAMVGAEAKVVKWCLSGGENALLQEEKEAQDGYWIGERVLVLE